MAGRRWGSSGETGVGGTMRITSIEWQRAGRVRMVGWEPRRGCDSTSGVEVMWSVSESVDWNDDGPASELDPGGDVEDIVDYG
jgi:hypothetical protein